LREGGGEGEEPEMILDTKLEIFITCWRQVTAVKIHVCIYLCIDIYMNIYIYIYIIIYIYSVVHNINHTLRFKKCKRALLVSSVCQEGIEKSIYW